MNKRLIMRGKRLRKARRARKLTQKQLAKRAKCGQGTISEYESGKRSYGTDKLDRFVETLQVRADFLMGYSDKMELDG